MTAASVWCAMGICRSKSLEVLIAILYLKGVSTRDFEEALVALLGKDAGGLSASTIGRLKEAWSDEHVRWSKRDLSAKRHVYFWADGIHVQGRLEDEAQCLLVIIGATPDGKKELVVLIDGARKSAQSWRELLLDLKRAGFRWRLSLRSPTVRSASGRRSEIWPMTRGQRGWVHKTANVLDKLPDLRGVLQFFRDPHRAYGLRRTVSAQAPRGELGRKRLDTQGGEVWRVSHE